MSNNVLPNLSKWFEVPVGATIPAGTHYAIAYSDGSHDTAKGSHQFRAEEAGTYFTEHKIKVPKKTLEDVIRAAGNSVADIAKAVEAFYAEQKSKQPKVIIDAGGDMWRLNAVGTYDLWYDDLAGMILQDLTRERIMARYGIKEERY